MLVKMNSCLAMISNRKQWPQYFVILSLVGWNGGIHGRRTKSSVRLVMDSEANDTVARVYSNRFNPLTCYCSVYPTGLFCCFCTFFSRVSNYSDVARQIAHKTQSASVINQCFFILCISVYGAVGLWNTRPVPEASSQIRSHDQPKWNSYTGKAPTWRRKTDFLHCNLKASW